MGDSAAPVEKGASGDGGKSGETTGRAAKEVAGLGVASKGVASAGEDIVLLGLKRMPAASFKPAIPSLFHQIVILITSQQISFGAARRLRSSLYEHAAQVERLEPGSFVRLTPAIVGDVTDKQWKEWGLIAARVRTMRHLAKLYAKAEPAELNTHLLGELASVPGIGSWTLSALRVSLEHAPDLFLDTDTFIAKQMRALYPQADLRSPAARARFARQRWGQQSTAATLFLWRLNQRGITLLLDKQPDQLDRSCFF